MDNREAHVLRQLDKLGGIWPDQGPRDETGIEAYVEALIDLDPILLESAVLQVITTSKFYPKPAEIREAAIDLEFKAEGLPDPYEAWEMVMTAVRGGAGHPLVGGDHRAQVPQVVAKAVRYIGGWTQLAMSDNTVADRARFIDAYREVLKREDHDRRMLPKVREHVKALADDLRIDGRKALTDETALSEEG